MTTVLGHAGSWLFGVAGSIRPHEGDDDEGWGCFSTKKNCVGWGMNRKCLERLRSVWFTVELAPCLWEIVRSHITDEYLVPMALGRKCKYELINPALFPISLTQMTVLSSCLH